MPNTYVNKVTANGQTLIDLTEDTVTASTLMQGYTAHDASGAPITGTASGGGGDVSLRELICPQQTVTPSSYMASLEREEGIVIGGHYVVTYDGTEYLFTAGNLWGGNGICLGEQTYYYDHSTRADEIAPFLLWEVFNDVTRTPRLYAKDNNSHTIKVERIDRDGIETTSICPQQTVTTNSSYIGTLANTTAQLVVGDYYLVTYDGTEWMLTAASLYDGAIISVGDDMVRFDRVADDNIYPFLIYNDGVGMKFYALDANASHTVKVDRITEIPDSIALTTKTITANGTYRALDDGANGYSTVTVDVPTGGGTPTLQAKTTTPTTSQQTIQPDSGYDGLSSVTVNAIPSEYIVPSGNKAITQNGTNIDVTDYATVSVNVAGSSIKTATGTFTGNGTRTIDVTCDFEPDIVYFTSNPGTTASSGTVAAIIVRDMMTATRYRNNSTSNSSYAAPDIVNMNTSGSSYSWRATYANSKVTLYCYSSGARGLLTNGRTYTYTFMKWT